MADPEVDHRFIYDKEGVIDILHSPFFDFTPEVDDSVEEYVERILFTLADFIEEQVCNVQWQIVSESKQGLLLLAKNLQLLLRSFIFTLGLTGIKSLTADKVFDKYFPSNEIRNFEEFHINFLKLCSDFNSVMLGKHYKPPSNEDIKARFFPLVPAAGCPYSAGCPFLFPVAIFPVPMAGVPVSRVAVRVLFCRGLWPSASLLLARFFPHVPAAYYPYFTGCPFLFPVAVFPVPVAGVPISRVAVRVLFCRGLWPSVATRAYEFLFLMITNIKDQNLHLYTAFLFHTCFLCPSSLEAFEWSTSTLCRVLCPHRGVVKKDIGSLPEKEEWSGSLPGKEDIGSLLKKEDIGSLPEKEDIGSLPEKEEWSGSLPEKEDIGSLPEKEEYSGSLPEEGRLCKGFSALLWEQKERHYSGVVQCLEWETPGSGRSLCPSSLEAFEWSTSTLCRVLCPHRGVVKKDIGSLPEKEEWSGSLPGKEDIGSLSEKEDIGSLPEKEDIGSLPEKEEYSGSLPEEGRLCKGFSALLWEQKERHYSGVVQCLKWETPGSGQIIFQYALYNTFATNWQACYEKWSDLKGTGEKEVQRKQLVLDLLTKNVKEIKTGDTIIMTGLVVPPTLMMLKKSSQNLPQLKRFRLDLVPDVVFVPTFTIAALFTVKVLQLKQGNKTK
ncbi:hypothetical protein M5K25_001847 [Dendrobium thyrsiflorum]|uniref:Uncharacterized protein n=1 Tax=Dendrobium thyrsiflorum TaxID=117978 RepID=A0ABD0W2S8_DENTH